MPSRLTLVTAAFCAALIAQGATAVGGGPSSSAPAPAVAAAKKPKPTNLQKSKDLWATINVCDTADKANTVGIRGAMPGLGNRRSRLAMRIRVQYKSKTDGKWKKAGPTADSGWKRVGSTLRQVIESGQNFTFRPPTDGGSHLLRGSVRFRWKRGGKVVARERRITEGGHRTSVADPEGLQRGAVRDQRAVAGAVIPPPACRTAAGRW